MKKNKEKAFDAVRFMRIARDRISRDIQGMNYEEERQYIFNELATLEKPISGGHEAGIRTRESTGRQRCKKNP